MHIAVRAVRLVQKARSRVRSAQLGEFDLFSFVNRYNKVQLQLVTHRLDSLRASGSLDGVRLAVEIHIGGGGYEHYVHVATPEPDLGGLSTAEDGGGTPGIEAMEEVRADFDRLPVADVNRGPEGRVHEAGERLRGGATGGQRRQRVLQACQYAGLKCGGCLYPFSVGETMMSVSGSLIHPRLACEEALRETERVRAEKKLARGEETEANLA